MGFSVAGGYSYKIGSRDDSSVWSIPLQDYDNAVINEYKKEKYNGAELYVSPWGSMYLVKKSSWSGGYEIYTGGGYVANKGFENFKDRLIRIDM